MSNDASFSINISLSPEEFQWLYRVAVLQMDFAAPVQLVQRAHNIRQALMQPVIQIDLGADDYGTVSEEGDGDSGVSSKPARQHQRAGAH